MFHIAPPISEIPNKVALVMGTNKQLLTTRSLYFQEVAKYLFP